MKFGTLHLLSSASIFTFLQVTATEESEPDPVAVAAKVWTEWRNVTESESFIELFTQDSFEISTLDGKTSISKLFLVSKTKMFM